MKIFCPGINCRVVSSARVMLSARELTSTRLMLLNGQHCRIVCCRDVAKYTELPLVTALLPINFNFNLHALLRPINLHTVVGKVILAKYTEHRHIILCYFQRLLFLHLFQTLHYQCYKLLQTLQYCLKMCCFLQRTRKLTTEDLI